MMKIVHKALATPDVSWSRNRSPNTWNSNMIQMNHRKNTNIAQSASPSAKSAANTIRYPSMWPEPGLDVTLAATERSPQPGAKNAWPSLLGEGPGRTEVHARTGPGRRLLGPQCLAGGKLASPACWDHGHRRSPAAPRSRQEQRDRRDPSVARHAQAVGHEPPGLASDDHTERGGDRQPDNGEEGRLPDDRSRNLSPREPDGLEDGEERRAPPCDGDEGVGQRQRR